VAWFSVLTQITGRLEALLLEAKGSWGEAEKAYSSLLEDNPFDQVNFCIQVFSKLKFLLKPHFTVFLNCEL